MWINFKYFIIKFKTECQTIFIVSKNFFVNDKPIIPQQKLFVYKWCWE